MSQTRPPQLTITESEADPMVLEVEITDNHGDVIASQHVDFNPNPTWMSPSEQSDAIADAVRKVWDAATYHYTGNRVER